MNKDFPRIITMLRKEKNLSQKQVSTDLGISQALLSHYEKGIRECSLDFLIKTAEYYNVSCDFLLGRTPQRSGATLNIDDIPDAQDITAENQKASDFVPLMNKKIICNSLAVIYDILSKSKCKQLTSDVTNYLMLAVYKVFRSLYSANPDNHQTMFAIQKGLYQGYCESYMGIYATRFCHMTSGEVATESTENLRKADLSTELLSQEYPKQSSSLFNLIRHAESKIRKKT